MTGVPDGAVAGEMGEELDHRDLRAVFGGEPGEAIGALSRATSTGDPDDDVGVGGEDIRVRHVKNITRTHGRVKVAGASAHAFAIEARRAETRERLRSRERGPRLRGNALSPAVRPAAFGFAPPAKAQFELASVGVSLGAGQLRAKPSSGTRLFAGAGLLSEPAELQREARAKGRRFCARPGRRQPG